MTQLQSASHTPSSSIANGGAKRVEPGEPERREVAELSSQVKQTSQRLLDFLSEKSVENAFEAPRLAASFVRAIPDLSYSENRALIGLLNMAREGDGKGDFLALLADLITVRDPSAPLSRAIGSLEELYKEKLRSIQGLVIEGGLTPQQHVASELSTSALLAARLASPIGINLINPNWAPEEGATSIPASSTFIIVCGQSRSKRGQMVLAAKPTPDGNATDLRIVPFGGNWAAPIATFTLFANQSILAGRRLSTDSVVGIRGSGRVRAEQGFSMEGDYYWSRGGSADHESRDKNRKKALSYGLWLKTRFNG